MSKVDLEKLLASYEGKEGLAQVENAEDISDHVGSADVLVYKPAVNRISLAELVAGREKFRDIVQAYSGLKKYTEECFCDECVVFFSEAANYSAPVGTTIEPEEWVDTSQTTTPEPPTPTSQRFNSWNPNQ